MSSWIDSVVRQGTAGIVAAAWLMLVAGGVFGQQQPVDVAPADRLALTGVDGMPHGFDEPLGADGRAVCSPLECFFPIETYPKNPPFLVMPRSKNLTSRMDKKRGERQRAGGPTLPLAARAAVSLTLSPAASSVGTASPQSHDLLRVIRCLSYSQSPSSPMASRWSITPRVCILPLRKGTALKEFSRNGVMPRWFIRHEGKVFGPFDDARLRFLLDAKRFNDTAEYGQSWEGPWRPLLDTLKGNGSSLPKATPPSLSAAVQKPPPVGEVRSSAPGVTAEQRRQAATSASVTDAFFVEEKPQEDRPLVDPGLRLRRATLQQRRQATTHHVVAAMLALLVAVVSAVAALVITGSPVIRQFIPGRRIQVPTEKRRPNTRAGIEAAPKPGRPTVSSSAANFKPLQRPEENDTFGTGTWPNDRSAQSTSQASVQQPPPPPNIPAEPEEDTDDTRQLLRDPQHCMAEFNRPAFDPDLIDVAKLRSVAEDLRGRFVVEENRETVEDFLEVTRNRESKSSTGRKEWGGVIRFEPGGAHFRNEKGDAPWSLDELAGSSQTALEQIAKRAKEVFELTERLT